MRSSENLFRLPPFPPFPCASRYVDVGSVSEAMTRVCRSAESREAISLVIGPPGTGKSLLVQLIAEAYDSARKVIALGDVPIESPAAFYRQVLRQLGTSAVEGGVGDLHLALADQLRDEAGHTSGLLLVIDEAQSLSEEVLEAIRMVTNVMRRGEPRVTAVLCGGTKLDETLATPTMESFTQRVATRCYLHPMNSEETRTYIHDAIRRCGAEPTETIADEAIASVHHASCGIPRLVNQLMTEAIDCAELAGQTVISEQIIDQAWAKLQQLPGPIIEEQQTAIVRNDVEFGELDSAEQANTDVVEELSAEIATEPQPSQDPTADSNAERTDAAGFMIDPNDMTPMLEELSPVELSQAAATRIEEGVYGRAKVDDLGMEPPASQTAAAKAVSPACASPAELFGQFDEEEELRIGGKFLARHSPSFDAATFAEVTPLQPESDSDEEASEATEMLHQQVIGIASQLNEVVTPELSATTEDTDAPEVSAPQGEPETQAAPVLWLTETEDGRLVRDDSDLLVVEDDVRRDAPITLTRIDGQEQTVSVDFQAMLNKMRAAE